MAPTLTADTDVVDPTTTTEIPATEAPVVPNTRPLSHTPTITDLVQDPNHPRPMAAEATDEDYEEAHAFYYHPHPPGYRGRPLEGALCLGFSW